MNVFLWILQIVLAVAMAGAGLMKLTTPREKLSQSMAWVNDFTDVQVKSIAAVEVVGALGLVLPAWTGIAPILTPIAAAGIAVIMVGAIIVHARLREYTTIAAPAVLGVIAVVVAWGRFGPYSY